MVDERGVLHVPGALPAVDPAARQDWDGLRAALRDRLAGELGTLQMWWRDHDDPNRTSVTAFGDRAMCVATPVTTEGRARHRLEILRWVPGSLTSSEFHGPGPGAVTREDRPPTLGALPTPVRDLLGHLPAPAQWYLQVPLLTTGEDVDGQAWYHVWTRPEPKLTAWLWVRTSATVTFAHGQRVVRGGGGTPVEHWDLRCWRATCA